MTAYLLALALLLYIPVLGLIEATAERRYRRVDTSRGLYSQLDFSSGGAHLVTESRGGCAPPEADPAAAPALPSNVVPEEQR